MTANIRAHSCLLIYKGTFLFKKMDIMHDSQYTNRPWTLFAHNVLKHVKSHTPGRSIQLHCLDHKAKLTLTKSPPWIMKSFITLPKENSTHEQAEIKSQASVVFLNKYFVITSYTSMSKMCSKTCISVNMQLWIILLDCDIKHLYWSL